MLAKRFRLSKRDIARLFKKGQSFRQDLLSVRFVKNNAAQDRFAVIIPKSIAKKAVLRSRLRRKTFEYIADLPKKSVHFDVSFSLKALPSEAEIGDLLQKAWQRIDGTK